MEYELKELSLNDSKDIYEMIQEIGPGENGFGNSGYHVEYNSFSDYLLKHHKISNGIDLHSEYVPQTMFWFYVNHRPVGIGKLRHYLNDALMKKGGHIGYAIRPSERGKGYGNLILKELLKKAKEIGVEKALLTVDEKNIYSRRVIENNNGVLENIVEDSCRYWINLV